MNDGDVYAPAKNLACVQSWDIVAEFCVLAAGNVPLLGINGSLAQGKMAQRKMAQLREQGHHACKRVPLDDDHDSYKIGLLTLNHVKHAHQSFGTQLVNREDVVHDHRRPRHCIIRRLASSTHQVA